MKLVVEWCGEGETFPDIILWRGIVLLYYGMSCRYMYIYMERRKKIKVKKAQNHRHHLSLFLTSQHEKLLTHSAKAGEEKEDNHIVIGGAL